MNKNRTVFLVERNPKNKAEFAITKEATIKNQQTLINAISVYNNTKAFCLPVVTDAFEYQGKDQVIPLQPEQIFFMDYVEKEDIRDKSILEIGLVE